MDALTAHSPKPPTISLSQGLESRSAFDAIAWCVAGDVTSANSQASRPASLPTRIVTRQSVGAALVLDDPS